MDNLDIEEEEDEEDPSESSNNDLSKSMSQSASKKRLERGYGSDDSSKLKANKPLLTERTVDH